MNEDLTGQHINYKLFYLHISVSLKKLYLFLGLTFF